MLKIGSIEDNDGEYIIHREFYRQGMIFKDEEAYKFHNCLLYTSDAADD